MQLFSADARIFKKFGFLASFLRYFFSLDNILHILTIVDNVEQS